jgi:hypothetical protein
MSERQLMASPNQSAAHEIDRYVFRLLVCLFAVPATAAAFVGLAKLKAQVDELRVVDYVRRVQPQLAADPRFKYVNLGRDSVSGCVSNREALVSLKEFIVRSKPPTPLSYWTVKTNESAWNQREEMEHFHQRAQAGAELVSRADAVLKDFGDLRFIRPKGTNKVVTVAEFEAILRPIQHRALAVIIIPAFGFDQVTNQATEAATTLKQCGFQRVAVVVSGWGEVWPYYDP